MKILLVSNMYPDRSHPTYGIFVKKFVDEIQKLQIECDMAVLHKKSGGVAKLIGYFIFFWSTFCKVLGNSYDVIYIHYVSISSIPVIFASYFKRGLIIYSNVHGSDVIPENSRQESLQKYTKIILSKSKKIIVPSKYFKDITCSKYGIISNKVFVYPSAGVNSEQFYQYPKDKILRVKNKMGLNCDELTFGMAGRISKDKGWDVFVDAISKLINEHTHANFIIVGSGAEEELLANLISSKNLSNAILRIPMLSQNELRDFYNAIDYFVFPTKRAGESLGLVALEAMACGTPVIGSNYAALKDYIRDQYNGYRFRVGDAERLAEAINEIVDSDDIEKYQSLQRGAIETAGRYSTNWILPSLKIIFS